MANGFPRRGTGLSSGRRMGGTVLAEGIIGIGLIVIGSILGLFFVVHTWQIFMYKQKLALAASEAVQATAEQATIVSCYDSWSDSNNLTSIQQTAQTKVTSFLAALGLTAIDSTVQTSLDGRILTVLVSCSDLPVLGAPPLFPCNVTVEDSASAPIRIIMPPGLLTIKSSNGVSVTIPTYGSSVDESDFTRPFSKSSISIAPGTAEESQTLGTIIDPGWLDLDPVYNK